MLNMSKRFVVLPVLFVCFLSSPLQTESPLAQSLDWFRTYGGTENEFGYSVQQTSDSGYIVAAGSLLIKTDWSGDTIWTRHYTVPDYLWSELYCVQQTYDSGYIAVGRGRSFSDPGDVILVKIDCSGETLWTRTHGGDSRDVGWSVQQTSDSGFVIAGLTESFGAGGEDFYVMKTDSAGNSVWDSAYGGSAQDQGHSVRQTADGGYIVAGWTASFGAGLIDFYLIKIDPAGHVLWDSTYGGSSSERAFCVRQTFDGGYVAAGHRWVNGLQVYLIKTDSTGHTLWDRLYGQGLYNDAWCIEQTYDSGYIMCGLTNFLDPQESDLYLIKTDPAGHIVWSRIFGGRWEEGGYWVEQTADSGYIAAGYSSSYDGRDADVYLVKVAPYQRGDINRDGSIDIVDIVLLINYLFRDGPAPDPLQAGDVNCDTLIGLVDVIYLINYLFRGGPPPC